MRIFGRQTLIYQLRWFILFAIAVAGLMTWYDTTGRRMMSFEKQEQWSSSGPGTHK